MDSMASSAVGAIFLVHLAIIQRTPFLLVALHLSLSLALCYI